MIISTCGFGSTGSSAISDYLCEFGQYQVIDNVEFNICYLPDGLSDLAYHITSPVSRTLASSYAIERFYKMVKQEIVEYYSGGDNALARKIIVLTDEFIDEITQAEWYGFENSGYRRMKGVWQSILLGKVFPILEHTKEIKMYPLSKIRVSADKEVFWQAARKYVKGLLRLLGWDGVSPLVLDQAFSGNNPQAVFPFFEDPYAIVVDRDPRDIYIFAKEILEKKKFFKLTRFMPTHSVEEFVKYYKVIRDNQPYQVEDSRILKICFEDMIYNYESTTKLIREFCGLGENKKKFSIFNPEVSMPNTRLYSRFPKYKKQIMYIEEQLGQYLYDFEKYPYTENLGEMFSGCSPLNKK